MARRRLHRRGKVPRSDEVVISRNVLLADHAARSGDGIGHLRSGAGGFRLSVAFAVATVGRGSAVGCVHAGIVAFGFDSRVFVATTALVVLGGSLL